MGVRHRGLPLLVVKVSVGAVRERLVCERLGLLGKGCLQTLDGLVEEVADATDADRVVVNAEREHPMADVLGRPRNGRCRCRSLPCQETSVTDKENSVTTYVSLFPYPVVDALTNAVLQSDTVRVVLRRYQILAS